MISLTVHQHDIDLHLQKTNEVFEHRAIYTIAVQVLAAIIDYIIIS